MTRLTRLTLRLARNPDAGFPDGDDRYGYVLVAPLDGDHRLDAALWQTERAACTVRRFSPEPGESAGGLLTHRGSHWRFAWDEQDEGPDDAAWKLADHRLEPGAYLTIANGDGEALVYRVTEAVKV
jgi:hypothetical protein